MNPRTQESPNLLDRLGQRLDDGAVVNNAGYHNAPAARRGRLRGARRARARGWPKEVEARRFLLLMEEMLRNTGGVNVRLPSHVAPPFRATPFAHEVSNVTLDGTGAAVDQLLTTVDLGDGATEMPGAHRGVITHVAVFAFVTATATQVLDPRDVMTWDLVKNGQPVAGYKKRLPVVAGIPSSFMAPAVGVAVHGGPDFNLAPALAPVHLRAEDSFTVRGKLTAAATTGYDSSASVRIGGYFYPVRADEDSIRGTIVD